MKVITTVGTSIFENYQKETSRNLPYYDELEESFYRNRDAHKDYIDDLQYDEVFSLWIDNNFNTSSAEITSLLAIQEEIKDSLEVYLIATETILSRIAAEIIQTKLNGYNAGDGKTNKVFFEADKEAPECDVIQGLDVKNADEFSNTGLPNLIERLKEIGINKEKIILNITGGYKGVIPYLTILGQVYKGVTVMYLYENTQKVIKIPELPINFDIEFCEKHYMSLQRAYRDNPVDSDINKELIGKQLVYFTGEKLNRTALGDMLWDYIDKQPEENLIGTAFEMLFFEYISQNKFNYSSLNTKKEKVYNCVWRGLKRLHKKHPNIESDFDLTLKSSEESPEFITASIKAFSQIKIIDNKRPSYAFRQFEDHVKYFKNNELIPEAFLIIIYLPPHQKIEELKNELCQMKALVVNDSYFLNTGFEVRYVVTSKSKVQSRNAYEERLNNPLKKDEFKTYIID
jgi:CRISPR/Cas system-associated protein Csm6